MQAGQVPVVAGFQGIGPDNRVTTLGRGGSDTSAVALAAALHADRCDIYTDVDGVYTTDPRIVPKARKLTKIAYEEMLELASVGAKVLQTRSVELAMKQRVRVQVLSSFEGNGLGSDLPGTMVVDEDEIVEQAIVSGIAYSRDEAKITVRRVPDRPGIAAAIFGPLSDGGVNVDMIVQNVSADGTTDMTFTVGRADLPRAKAVLNEQIAKIGFAEILADHNLHFIGPKAEHIRLMGDKIEAKKTAKKLGIPVVPGSDGAVGPDDDAMAIAQAIGFPVLVTFPSVMLLSLAAAMRAK